MIYLEEFKLPERNSEDDFLLYSYHMNMSYNSQNNIHPFRFFSAKELWKLDFSDITLLYGGNGSGKSTLLGLIAEKLGIYRSSPPNKAPLTEEYAELCDAYCTKGNNVPSGSKLISSDDVFEYLLNIRAINTDIIGKREQVIAEYESELADSQGGKVIRIQGLHEMEKLKKRYEVNHSTKSAYVSKRIPQELVSASNGESAYRYFTKEIRENALYLLDEPENSLSPMLQTELVQFIEDSVRFYRCQFIISTHSPFLLSMKRAKVYDLDARPVSVKKWTELENIRIYQRLFEERREEFKS